jgi:hypothetical protein
VPAAKTSGGVFKSAFFRIVPVRTSVFLAGGASGFGEMRQSFRRTATRASLLLQALKTEDRGVEIL